MVVTAVLLETVLFFGVFSTLIGLADAQTLGLPAWFGAGAVLAFVLSGCCVGALYLMNLYDFKEVRTYPQFLSRVPGFLLAAVLAAALLAYALFPRTVLTWPGLALVPLLILAIVLAARAVWYRVLAAWPFVERVLVIGRTELARTLAAELARHPRYRILDIVEPGRPGRVARDGSLFLYPGQRAIRGGVKPDRIVVAMSERRGRVPMEALLDAKRFGIAIEDGLHLYERLTGRIALDWLQPSHLIFSPRYRPTQLQCFLQRAVSVTLAAIGLIVGAPLFALIAVLIKLDSRGPVFFVQERIGRYGERFALVKFRTMHPAEQRPSEWVGDNGNRITRVGYWLRKFRMDELPQLYNVLMGHMNLVGPRPHPACNYELFMTHIPFYAFRSVVRPGITGWAQVRYGYANNLEEETEKMRYDLYYIKHLSLAMDLHILLLTIKVVVLGQQRVAPAVRTADREAEGWTRLDVA